MARVGILGGTFDPPHVAHAAMAVAARDVLRLDSVLLMPAPEPPHKPSDGVSPYAHRLAMVEIAAADVERVAVSRFEERREGVSYTVDMLRDYREHTGERDIFFLVGSDSVRAMDSWREPAALLSVCTLAVFMRPGAPLRLDVPGAASVVVFEEPVLDVSSSDVRERVRRGQPVDALVVPGVLSYIREHSLYL